MGKRKTKAIQKELGTFRHNQSYPGTIQGYWGIFRALCNSGIIRTVANLEPWHIPNHKHIQNPGNSQSWYIQSAGISKIQDIFKNLPNIYYERIEKTVIFFIKNFQKIIINFTVQAYRVLYFIKKEKIYN